MKRYIKSPKDTKFEKDIHWDIGHGFSDEF